MIYMNKYLFIIIRSSSMKCQQDKSFENNMTTNYNSQKQQEKRKIFPLLYEPMKEPLTRRRQPTCQPKERTEFRPGFLRHLQQT